MAAVRETLAENKTRRGREMGTKMQIETDYRLNRLLSAAECCLPVHPHKAALMLAMRREAERNPAFDERHIPAVLRAAEQTIADAVAAADNAVAAPVFAG